MRSSLKADVFVWKRNLLVILEVSDLKKIKTQCHADTFTLANQVMTEAAVRNKIQADRIFKTLGLLMLLDRFNYFIN